MKIIYYLPALLWALVILFLTLVPGQLLPKSDYWEIKSFDKYVHFFIFFVQVILLSWGEKKHKTDLYLRDYFKFVLLGSGFGAFIEIIQTMIPARTFDFNDMYANAIGGLLGAVFFYLAMALVKNKRTMNI
jgi:VanZ family protein